MSLFFSLSLLSRTVHFQSKTMKSGKKCNTNPLLDTSSSSPFIFFHFKGSSLSSSIPEKVNEGGLDEIITERRESERERQREKSAQIDRKWERICLGNARGETLVCHCKSKMRAVISRTVDLLTWKIRSLQGSHLRNAVPETRQETVSSDSYPDRGGPLSRLLTSQNC